MSIIEADKQNQSILEIQKAIKDLKAESYDTKKEIQAIPLHLSALKRAKYDVEDLEKVFATQKDIKSLEKRVSQAERTSFAYQDQNVNQMLQEVKDEMRQQAKRDLDQYQAIIDDLRARLDDKADAKEVQKIKNQIQQQPQVVKERKV